MNIELSVKPIVNNLYEAKLIYESWQFTGIASDVKNAKRKAIEQLRHKIIEEIENLQGLEKKLELVEKNVLKIFKMPIVQLGNLADHYFLSETPTLDNSIGWDAIGIELRGKVKVIGEQLERIKQFALSGRYNIHQNNCEHFVNYIYFGLPYSSQQETRFKNITSRLIKYIQPTQSVSLNINQNISNYLQISLLKAKLEQLDKEFYNLLVNSQ